MLVILLFDKLADSKLPDILQILFYADQIVLSISGVSTIEVFAWIVFAFVTKDSLTGCHIVAFRAFPE
jgi:hypothetical protein